MFLTGSRPPLQLEHSGQSGHNITLLGTLRRLSISLNLKDKFFKVVCRALPNNMLSSPCLHLLLLSLPLSLFQTWGFLCCSLYISGTLPPEGLCWALSLCGWLVPRTVVTNILCSLDRQHQIPKYCLKSKFLSFIADPVQGTLRMIPGSESLYN